jgi:hypothetical protein
MGKLRKLRTRFISSIGAVKRSVLRTRLRQSESSSTASNPTTLTRLASLDSAVPASTGAGAGGGSRAQKRKLQVRLQAQEQEDLQLHWNEARRIYSEPVQATHGLSRGPGSRCSSRCTAADSPNLPCAADQVRSPSSLCGSARGDSQISDGEDYDDVFLQSWEETG